MTRRVTPDRVQWATDRRVPTPTPTAPPETTSTPPRLRVNPKGRTLQTDTTRSGRWHHNKALYARMAAKRLRLKLGKEYADKTARVISVELETESLYRTVEEKAQAAGVTVAEYYRFRRDPKYLIRLDGAARDWFEQQEPAIRVKIVELAMAGRAWAVQLFAAIRGMTQQDQDRRRQVEAFEALQRYLLGEQKALPDPQRDAEAIDIDLDKEEEHGEEEAEGVVGEAPDAGQPDGSSGESDGPRRADDLGVEPAAGGPRGAAPGSVQPV